MNKVLPEDLYAFSFPHSIFLSPDGKRIAFVRQHPCKEVNGYPSVVCVGSVQGGKPRELCPDARLLGWADDETLLCLLTLTEPDGARKVGCHTLSLNGETRLLFWRAGMEELYPLSRSLFAYTVTERLKEEEPGVITLDELPFWTDGRGVRNGMRTALWLYDVKEKTSQRVSPKAMQVTHAAASPGGEWLAFAGVSYASVKPDATGLYLFRVPEGTLHTLEAQSLSRRHVMLSFLQNDVLVYAAGEPRFLGSNPSFYACDCKTGRVSAFPFADVSIGGGLMTDVSYGPVNAARVDRGTLYFSSPVETAPMLRRLEEDGRCKPIPGTEGVLSFDVRGGALAFCAVRPKQPPEIYWLNLSDGKKRRVTAFHDCYLKERALSYPRAFSWRNRHGLAFRGWFLPPPNVPRGQSIPAILCIHGGPLGVWGASFHHEMQCMAAAGFGVFYTNPRGSSGRGEAFANLHANAGTLGYQDLMDFCDSALTAFSQIDPHRLGVCGGSYGGFLCNHIIGHTRRFAAAVSQRSISNFVTKQLCADNGYTVTRAFAGATPFDDPARLWALSPLRLASRAATPTLFLQSREDYCCYLADSLQMYAALKAAGVPARLCLFDKESHGLSRGGHPQSRVRRLQEILRWFFIYLSPDAPPLPADEPASYPP